MVGNPPTSRVARRSRFETTHWSVVCAAGGFADPEAAHQAVNDLCQRYWTPLFTFATLLGWKAEDAEDATQSFLTHFIAKGYIGAADRARGRFRTFLLTSFRHYLTRCWHYDRRVKRGGGVRHARITTTASKGVAPKNPTEVELVDEFSVPSREYDKRWAFLVLDAALCALRSELSETQSPETFDVLKALLSRGSEPREYDELATRLDTSTGAIAAAVCRMRRRYFELVLAEVTRTVANPADAPDEMRYLLGLVSSR